MGCKVLGGAGFRGIWAQRLSSPAAAGGVEWGRTRGAPSAPPGSSRGSLEAACPAAQLNGLGGRPARKAWRGGRGARLREFDRRGPGGGAHRRREINGRSPGEARAAISIGKRKKKINKPPASTWRLPAAPHAARLRSGSNQCGCSTAGLFTTFAQRAAKLCRPLRVLPANMAMLNGFSSSAVVYTKSRTARSRAIDRRMAAMYAALHGAFSFIEKLFLLFADCP